MPRIPLPVKLLISYLGVLLLGAGPTFFYIRVVLQGDLLRESALRMSSQISKVAESLRSVPEADRRHRRNRNCSFRRPKRNLFITVDTRPDKFPSHTPKELATP